MRRSLRWGLIEAEFLNDLMEVKVILRYVTLSWIRADELVNLLFLEEELTVDAAFLRKLLLLRRGTV